MFKLEQIIQAHDKVKSGADFPKYIQAIKQLGVITFETWVKDSHTVYFGAHDYQIQSKPQYAALKISDETDSEKFTQCLKVHQQGGTDYHTFCNDCATTGIEKWRVRLDEMTCTYYDQFGSEILVEVIPSVQ